MNTPKISTAVLVIKCFITACILWVSLSLATKSPIFLVSKNILGKCNKEEIKVETLKNKTDSWWTTIMFKIIVKDGFAPMYILKYMIIDKQ